MCPGNLVEITIDDLRRIAPSSAAHAPKYLAHLNHVMREYGINTKLRMAAFIAQLMHESGSLRYVREIASGAAYEGREDLGNTHPGDGKRFRGRGLIQITGRGNYRACGAAMGLDLDAMPELLEEPLNACRSAAWFWESRGLNALADAGQFERITKRINGGTNGREQRNALYARALSTLDAVYF